MRNVVCRCGNSIALPSDFSFTRIRCGACGEPVAVAAVAAAKPRSPEMALVRFACACGWPFALDPKSAGPSVTCPDCGKTSRVPVAPEAAPPTTYEVEAKDLLPEPAPVTCEVEEKDLIAESETVDVQEADLIDEDAVFVDDPPAAPTVEGKPFGRFRLVELLGRGGMGDVWKAYDTDDLLPDEKDRWVAIKTMTPTGEAEDEADRRRFVREADAALKLQHPGIIRVREVGEAEGQYYILMDYVDGASLQSILDKGVSPAKALGWLVKVADAVAFAHSAGVLHRDLKPANILVSSDGRPVVVDFGLAKITGSSPGDPTLTRTGQILGTPLYMAPEQIRDTKHGVTARTDVYALGAIAYEIVAGRKPFQGGSRAEIFARILGGRPALPHAASRGLPAGLDAVILKAMDRDPRKRFATAREFAEAIRRELGRQTRGRRILSRLPKWSPRIRAAAACASILLVGLVIWLVSGRDPETPPASDPTPPVAKSPLSEPEANPAEQPPATLTETIEIGERTVRTIDDARVETRFEFDVPERGYYWIEALLQRPYEFVLELEAPWIAIGTSSANSIFIGPVELDPRRHALTLRSTTGRASGKVVLLIAAIPATEPVTQTLGEIMDGFNVSVNSQRALASQVRSAWYRFHGIEGKTYRMILSGPSLQGRTLRLLDPYWRVVEEGKSGGSAQPQLAIDWTCRETGPHRICVTAQEDGRRLAGEILSFEETSRTPAEESSQTPSRPPKTTPSSEALQPESPVVTSDGWTFELYSMRRWGPEELVLGAKKEYGSVLTLGFQVTPPAEEGKAVLKSGRVRLSGWQDIDNAAIGSLPAAAWTSSLRLVPGRQQLVYLLFRNTNAQTLVFEGDPTMYALPAAALMPPRSKPAHVSVITHGFADAEKSRRLVVEMSVSGDDPDEPIVQRFLHERDLIFRERAADRIKPIAAAVREATGMELVPRPWCTTDEGSPEIDIMLKLGLDPSRKPLLLLGDRVPQIPQQDLDGLTVLSGDPSGADRDLWSALKDDSSFGYRLVGSPSVEYYYSFDPKLEELLGSKPKLVIKDDVPFAGWVLLLDKPYRVAVVTPYPKKFEKQIKSAKDEIAGIEEKDRTVQLVEYVEWSKDLGSAFARIIPLSEAVKTKAYEISSKSDDRLGWVSTAGAIPEKTLEVLRKDADILVVVDETSTTPSAAGLGSVKGKSILIRCRYVGDAKDLQSALDNAEAKVEVMSRLVIKAAETRIEYSIESSLAAKEISKEAGISNTKSVTDLKYEGKKYDVIVHIGRD